ncbi:NitT/TauT family transport system ATP-binding protein [Caldalkalibacillus uzonensis]|uniref:NitT/TauT family transport system ATP-binding protein n=2 Tax=Caldalkalibacillus uzonensis TaxID=353224 RepID=A0ABU0CVG1_9BACI|nr:ABC transporter ATP-binding protein [Caldalkalibacillus uzonensis]MDQ0340107.1 NitT/TauT family transport system ATP-binding protein [Caldalkalibacillus uzonensis]
MGLQVKGVSKIFYKHDEPFHVFDDINLNVETGQFVSLLGPSGCGKSTLLNIIAGLEQATKGEVVVDGKKVEGPGPERGVVFQEPALMPWLNVLENVTFALKGMDKAKQKEIALQHLKLVHLSKFIHSYPHELSGGMRQRVAIARALAMNPQVLLMDEPFGALDEQTRMMLHRELSYIWMQTKKTIVFVTHNIREAVQLSDRIVLMGTRPGRIIEEFEVNLPRPRQTTDPRVAALEEQIMELLGGEIEKVMREEMGDDYNSQKAALLYGTHRDMGSHI